jgi:hypothetical protein
MTPATFGAPQAPTQGVDLPTAATVPASGDYWVDPATGLIWTKQDNGSDITQTAALSYCENLRTGGLADWRLPTIDQIAAIYDSSIGGDHVKGGLKLTVFYWYWSSSPGPKTRGGLGLSFHPWEPDPLRC